MRRVLIVTVLLIGLIVLLRGPQPQAAAPAQVTPTVRGYLPIALNPPTSTPTATPTATPTPTILPTPTPTRAPTLPGIANGGFEQGHVAWFEIPANAIITQFADEDPYTGAWLAMFGGENNSSDELQQTVTLPSGVVYLRYARAIDSNDLAGVDRLDIMLNTTVIFTELMAFPEVWQERSFNVSAYAGQTVTLRLRMSSDDSGPSTIYLDDVTFAAGP